MNRIIVVIALFISSLVADVKIGDVLSKVRRDETQENMSDEEKGHV